MSEQYDVDVAILGAGTAGMAAFREALKATPRVVMIDGGKLGTTCARVGCMPSKLLIAAADAAYHARHADLFGVNAGPVEVDGRAVMARLHRERDRFVGFVHDAVADFDMEKLIRHYGKLRDDHTIELDDGRTITARSIVIATGSRPNIPPPFEVAADRLITNDDLFYMDDIPGRVAVFGAGVIGLELGQALHRLGSAVHLFGRNHAIGPLSDPDLKRNARDLFAAEFPAHWHADADISREGEEIVVSWTDTDADGKVGDRQEARFDYLLAATGRRANVDRIGLENTSVECDDRGVPIYDPLSMRAGDSDIFIVGDGNADLPLLHEAADEGRIAGENAARYPHVYRRARRTPLGVVFSDPQIGLAGRGYRELMDGDVAFETGAVSYADQGRARVMGINKGALHIYAERETGILLGMEMVGPAAEHLSHLLAWAIESRLTVTETLERPFYHPVLEEGVRTALRNLNAKLGFAANPPLRCIDCGPGG